jgi:D-hydroxyproline dehydrogenase
MHNNNTKIAVVGAGIIGINCALALQQKGFQVTLVDQQGIAQGCSKANAGHFATEQVFPLAEPEILWQMPKLLCDPLGPIALSPSYLLRALPWFLRFMFNARAKQRHANSMALRALNHQAIEYYQPLLRVAGAEHLLTRQGSLLVFERTDLVKITALHRQYQQAGINVQLLQKSEIAALEPNINHNITFALFFPDVAHTINPHQLCVVLADYAMKLGVCFHKAQIARIETDDHKVTLYGQAAQPLLQVDKLVLATGAWSKSIVNALGYKLPIEAERGYSYTLLNSSGLTRPVASAERKFIITPMEQGLRFAGTVEFSGLTQAANDKRAEVLYTHAQALLSNVAELTRSAPAKQQNSIWSGYRPSLPDSLPVIGQAPSHPNIYFALGHQHLGLTQGAKTGTLIAQLVANQLTDIDLQPFSIRRFN